MSTIAVIGAGHIGRNFSIAAIRAGNEVLISNSEGPQTLGALVAELGPGARAASAADAATAGDFALVAVPLAGADSLPVEPLAGKAVLTTINYFAKRDGPVAELDTGELTVPGYVQRRLPRSRVVRAFNHINAAEIVSDGEPAGTPDRRALGYAGDDADAKRTAAELYEALGFDAVDVGGLADAWKLDVDQPTFVVRQTREQLLENLARAERHVAVP